jgi:hypothetical protein
MKKNADSVPISLGVFRHGFPRVKLIFKSKIEFKEDALKKLLPVDKWEASNE